jgi:predicted site-specific integrase-resolvase
MRAAIYARVSTSNNGQDPSVQTREIREYCERRGWQIAGGYVDIGISGTKEKRPELDRLLAERMDVEGIARDALGSAQKALPAGKSRRRSGRSQ